MYRIVGSRCCVMIEKGDARLGPHGTVLRCFDPRLRSSAWISQCGEMFTLYHDTDVWSTMSHPRCDESGSLRVSGNNQRLERALAEAWVARPDTNTMCWAQVRNAVDGLHASNIEWKYGGSTRKRVESRVPNCIRGVASALSESGTDSLAELAARCHLSESTVLSYLCKGLCNDASLVPVELLRPLVGDDIMGALQLVDATGPLGDVVASVELHLLQPPEHVHNRVRLGRIIKDISEVFPTFSDGTHCE